MSAIWALPLVGWTRPQSIRMVVVLPAPFAPRKPKTVPGAILRERSCTASVSPNDLLRRSRRMAGSLMDRIKCRGACVERLTNRHFKMEKKTGEAMSFRAVQKLMRFFSLLALVAFLISKAVAADPAAEMASFSVFNNINVADLAKGEPKAAHGPAPDAGRTLLTTTPARPSGPPKNSTRCCGPTTKFEESSPACSTAKARDFGNC